MLALRLALLAAALAAENAACVPLPQPSGDALRAASDNGITNPALLDTLVKAVDEVRVYRDSKTIVDQPLKAPPAEVAAAFNALSLPADPTQRNDTLKQFIDQWLLPPGEEMTNATGVLEQEPPAWFETLPDQAARQWAQDLFDIWGRLTRQLIPAVAQQTQLYTMLPVPNPFVVIKGLLASNLTTLAENILDNFRHLMQTYGHIPNGIRTYYLNRSQPPLYSEMVRVVWEATQDASLLRDHLPAILLEHAYWTSPPKQVIAVGPTGQRYNVSRYYARWQQPRPESYIEDVETARKAGLPTDPPDADTQQLWRDLASGAESGWDYSTRWFEDGQNLTTIRTTKILPADLNGFLLQMEENIADFAVQLGCTALEQQYRQLAANRREALNSLFWSNEDSQWHDLVCTPAGVEGNLGGMQEEEAVAGGIVTRVCDVEQLTDPFASNWVPMWAGAVPAGSPQALAAVQALSDSGLLGVGGVAMSLTDSGQQWDHPNVWPPNDWIIIDAFERFGGAPGAALAREIAQRFLSTVFATYQETGRMYEKFNAEQIGIPGGGGEYEVVDGFGWTNGASLDLMQRFGFSTT